MAFASGSYGQAMFPEQKTSDLQRILAAYGLLPQAQVALMELLALSGVLSPNVLEQDLMALGVGDAVIEAAQKIASQYAKKMIDINGLMSQLFTSNVAILDIQTWFLRVTQRVFFARPGGKERWEMLNLQWMQDNANKVSEFITLAGIDAGVSPAIEDKFDVGLVLGATYRVMHDRIAFAKKYQDQIDKENIYLLTGDRDVTEGIDGKDNIEKVRAFFERVMVDHLMSYFSHLPNPESVATIFLSAQKTRLTEAGLMLYLAHQAELRCRLTNAPKVKPELAEKSRPTTITTVQQWMLEWPQSLDIPKNCLVVSSAPFLRSQHADVASALKAGGEGYVTVKLLTVGNPMIPASEFERLYPTLNRNRVAMEAFGGFIYGLFALVARQLKSLFSDAQLDAIRRSHNIDVQREKASQAARVAVGT